MQDVEFAYFATLQFMQDIFSEFNSAENVFVDPVTHSDGLPRRFIRAVGSGLGLPFKKQLLPVAVNNTKKRATDFVLALCNVTTMLLRYNLPPIFYIAYKIVHI